MSLELVSSNCINLSRRYSTRRTGRSSKHTSARINPQLDVLQHRTYTETNETPGFGNSVEMHLMLYLSRFDMPEVKVIFRGVFAGR
jgi:hypothetical protein